MYTLAGMWYMMILAGLDSVEILSAVNSCGLLYFPTGNRHALLIHSLVESILQSEKSITENKPSSCIGQPIPTLINMLPQPTFNKQLRKSIHN